MRELLQIELRTLIEQITKYHERFGENDIRSSYLDGYFQILRTYYCAYFHLDSDDILLKYYEIYQRDNFTKDDLVIHLIGHKNLLNSFLVINCWSNFELFIALFCNSVLSESNINELLELDYNRIKKIVSKYSIDEETDNKLRKFIKNHIAHAPIVNKYGKLLKKISPYPSSRDRQNDREFLEFFGRLRNCIHSNYIYYGANDEDFTFNGEKYSFRHGKLLSHSPYGDDSIFKLTQNLKAIFQVIVDNLEYDKEIYDPSIELIKK
jgi:hypothetical protein